MEERKSNKGLLVVLILCVVIILVLSGLLILKTLNKETSGDNNDEITNTDSNVQETEVKDYDIAKAEELLEKFGFKDGIDYCGFRIYNSKYDEDYMKQQALKNVSQDKIKKMNCSEIYEQSDLNKGVTGYYKGENGHCPQNGTVDVISYDSVNEIYKKMYGTNMGKTGFQFYDYNDTLNSFVKLECGACGGACGPSYYVEKIKSAKQIGNELIIEVYYSNGHFYFKSPESDELVYDLDTKKIHTRLDVNSIEEFKKEVLNKYLDKLDVYEIVFEKNDNDYVFKKLSMKLS